MAKLLIDWAWLKRQRTKAHERKTDAANRKDRGAAIRWSGQHAAYCAVRDNATLLPDVEITVEQVVDAVKEEGHGGLPFWQEGWDDALNAVLATAREMGAVT